MPVPMRDNKAVLAQVANHKCCYIIRCKPRSRPQRARDPIESNGCTSRASIENLSSSVAPKHAKANLIL